MRRLLVAALVLAVVAAAGLAQAQEKEKKKGRSNPTGTWTWSVKMGDQTREMTLKLKLEGDKLTGALVGREGQPETAISDAKYQKGQLSFKVVRERNGVKMTSSYTGKVSRDTITGKISFEREGQTQSRDWEAKRVRAAKKEAKA